MADADKSLYAAPLGIEELAEEEQAIEIEIEDPESVTIGIGDTETSRQECGQEHTAGHE